MKGLYYCRVNRDDAANHGVIQKCLAQVHAFIAAGHEIDMISLSNKGVLKNDSLLYTYNFPVSRYPFLLYGFYFFRLMNCVLRNIDLKAYDFIYIRYPLADPLFMKLLRQAKSARPEIKIFIELPTYPYSHEMKGLIRKLNLYLDQYYVKALHRYVDFIVHYGQEEKVYQIPTINIRNGIELSTIPVSTANAKPRQLRLIAMANWSYWHGLDRLLHGLAVYQKQNPDYTIHLKVVGHGRELAHYQKLVQQHQLHSQVAFYAPRKGHELDLLFDQADIALGSLGMFRKNVKIDSSLKHREYCARAIPFILSTPDLDFPPTLPFVKYFPEEDAPIDVLELLHFFNKVQTTDYKVIMRKYAEENLSWEKQLEGVLSQLS